MQTSNQIIEEIKNDAANLQMKLLTLPATSETISKEQEYAIDKVQKGLLGWRSWELGELEKVFSG